MNHPDEDEWVRKAQAGDQGAFALLVEHYWDRLRRWLFCLTRKQHLAEDITQEALARAWVGLRGLQAEETFRVWLFRIARNCLLDSRRGPRGNEPLPLANEVGSKQDEPLDELLDREAHTLIQEALARLPDANRTAYLLWTQEDMPYHEIANVLGVSEKTARWRVYKARQALVKELQTYLDDELP